MNISSISKVEELTNQKSLSDCAKYAHTLDFNRKLDSALRTIEKFLKCTQNPVISCGGGKDGTAVALLAQLIGATDISIVCAEPPNPLPDREAHNKELKKWLGNEWTAIKYSWNVDAVLDGCEKYPDGLKMKMLSEYQKEHDVDGVIFGIRAAESRSRAINLAVRGEIYRVADGGWRCQPIAHWSAEDSICLAFLMDAPINPVYYKMQGCGNLEQLHDGTWWPHGLEDRSGWMKKYYPEYYELYERALKIESDRLLPCSY